MEHKNGDVEINIGATCDNEFPIPVPDEDPPKRSRMPRLPPRVTQSSKKSKFKLGCDGDAMSMKHFSGIVSAYANCGDKACGDKCCQLELNGEVDDNNKSETITLQTSVNSDKPVGLINGEEDTAQKMATRMLSRMTSKQMEIGDTVIELSRGINLITDIGSNNDVLNVDQEMVWVQVPCAVDSGSCANVAPEDVFGINSATTEKRLPKFFGADGSPIENLGALVAEGFSDDGHAMKIDFDIAKVTRPLLSVYKMTSNGHKVEFTEKGGTIQVKGSQKKIQLRQEGRLFMLDLWCQVPAKLARESPFIRQVAKA